MNRRSFVRSSLALAATLPATSFSDESRKRKFSLALTPGSIGVNVQSQQELNELAFRHGFESVEPRAEELAGMSADQVEFILGDRDAKNLIWAAAGLPVEFRKDEATFRESLAKLPAIAAGLQRAGATRMGTWLMPSHDELTYPRNYNQHVIRLREIASILKDHGLRLGLEYVGTQLLLVKGRYPFLHTFAETRELINEIGTGNVGFVLDTWHWWTANDTIEEILSLKNEDIVSVDLNDAPKGIEKRDQLDNERELPAATGVIDVASFVNALIRIGYDGPIRPEPFNKVLNELANEEACAATIIAMKKAVNGDPLAR
jgi:sugar phosphate isomerase/epimerase